MSETPQKKVKLNLGNLSSMPPKYRAQVKLLQLGRQNAAILRQKPAEIFKMDEVFKEAYGNSNGAWRSALHRVRTEVGIDMDEGEFLLLFFLNNEYCLWNSDTFYR